MEGHYKVKNRRLTWFDLNFKRLTLATVWRTDCRRGRVEAARPIREYVGIQARDDASSDPDEALELMRTGLILLLCWKDLKQLSTYWMWGVRKREVKESTSIFYLSNRKDCVTISWDGQGCESSRIGVGRNEYEIFKGNFLYFFASGVWEWESGVLAIDINLGIVSI